MVDFFVYLFKEDAILGSVVVFLLLSFVITLLIIIGMCIYDSFKPSKTYSCSGIRIVSNGSGYTRGSGVDLDDGDSYTRNLDYASSDHSYSSSYSSNTSSDSSSDYSSTSSD